METTQVKYYVVGNKRISNESVARSYAKTLELPIYEVFDEYDVIDSIYALELILRRERYDEIKRKSSLLSISDYQFIADNISFFVDCENQAGHTGHLETFTRSVFRTVSDMIKSREGTRALNALCRGLQDEIGLSRDQMLELPINLFYEIIVSRKIHVDKVKNLRHMGKTSIVWLLDNAREHGIEKLFVGWL